MTIEAASGRRAGTSAWVRMVTVAVAVVALDQLTKVVVRGAMGRGEQIDVLLGFQIVNVRNSGIAFGLLANGGALLVIVTAITLGVLLAWFATQSARPGLWVAIGVLVGGALGNLLDRLRHGEVTDFLDPPLWPAFNVADIAITVGVIGLIAIAFRSDRRAPEP